MSMENSEIIVVDVETVVGFVMVVVLETVVVFVGGCCSRPTNLLFLISVQIQFTTVKVPFLFCSNNSF